MPLYAPIHIESPGIINETWGIGVITPMGAFITSIIPPFRRIYAKAFIPKETTFKTIKGETTAYKLFPNMAMGIKKFNAYIPKPTPHYENIAMSITQVIPIDMNIIIEEISPGSFKIMPYNLLSQTITQPQNGWTSLF